ncbi:unnamed protein product [Phaedon cochleariae]|uniref:Ribosome-recycling factor, mitochondrial n=1 Tax=Phaedon cochleariae TaxID=80249 RepID=A0A9P0DIU4_PHACE|nr:unnamed protein product [Phaedon cochleariae]
MYNFRAVLHAITRQSSKQISCSRSLSIANLNCLKNITLNTEPHRTWDFCKRTSPSLQPIRHYAKGKDRKKEKGKVKVEVNETQLSETINIEMMKNQMQRILEQMKDEFIRHLSLRSTSGSLEMIPVNVDGKEHTLQELAQIVRKNPKTIVINMSIFPQAIPAALKAIEKSGMNLNPQQDGTTLFIPIPKVTKEHRENLAKNAKQLFVKCKDGIREVQTKYIKQVKRKEGISQDLARSVETQIVTVADGFISQGEQILESKRDELIGKD